MFRTVIDTNIFVSACLGGQLASKVIVAGIQGRFTPIMGTALLMEYEAVLAREWVQESILTPDERKDIFDAWMARCEWTEIYFNWRPNLSDEADNHLIELAVAGGASHIVSRNLKDLKGGELIFPQIRMLDAADFIKELNSSWLH